MQPKKPQIDVIIEIIEDCLMAFPVHALLISLYQQYQKRGFLTKKQLQALHIKAAQVPTMNPGRLATLEALIKKLPTRVKSELPEAPVETIEEDQSKPMIAAILEKYPQHKRVLFFKMKTENNESLQAREMDELKKFYKLVLK